MKRIFAGLVLPALAIALPVLAQEKQNFVINANTPEGQLLTSIGQETDDARKVTLEQDFLSKYPKHDAAGWVAGQLEASLFAQKDYDKVLQTADAAYAGGPDMDAAYYALKAAIEKGDAAQVKTWSARTYESAHKLVAAGKATDEESKQQLDYAKGVQEYSGYGLYTLALKSQPKDEVDLVDTLIKQDPKSQYLPEIANSYFAALTKAGEGGKACPAATRMAVEKNAEAMLYAADCGWRAGKADQVVSYGNKALEAVNTRAKREGVSDADYGSQKSSLAGTANFYIGVGYAMQMRYGPSIKALKAALPVIKGSPQTYGVAVFYLGLGDYSLGKQVGDKGQMREGMKYFQESAGIANPMQDQASKNAKLVLAELGGK